jgi:uncharacterized lipoprotein YajG
MKFIGLDYFYSEGRTMKKARFLLIMLMLTCSFFLTGCDAEKIMQTITQVAEGI